MVRVDESRENGGQWSGRGLNPQLLSRAASVSNGKLKQRAHAVLEKPSNYT